MKPTLLGDEIATRWNALTPDQRTCWHFWAMQHPITSAKGDRIALRGYQAYVQRNSIIGSMDPTNILTDHPPDKPPPAPAKVRAERWSKKFLNADNQTIRGGFVYLGLLQPLPAQINILVKQGYAATSARNRRLARTRHVTYAKTGEPPLINVQVPRGYYAETAGANKFSSIKGATSRRHPNKPIAQIITVDLETGLQTRQPLGAPG